VAIVVVVDDEVEDVVEEELEVVARCVVVVERCVVVVRGAVVVVTGSVVVVVGAWVVVVIEEEEDDELDELDVCAPALVNPKANTPTTSAPRAATNATTGRRRGASGRITAPTLDRRPQS